MTQDELNKIIENHQHWIKQDCEGWDEMRADLNCADLRWTNLYLADLQGANLCGANLVRVDLCCANLQGADMVNADLRGANLQNANLLYADLRGADLSKVNLRYANLCCADLGGANMFGADLQQTNLYDTINVPFIPYACPEFGSFIGFKKASGYIVKLEIPEDAKRLSATSRKCRCNKAKVLDIQRIDGFESKVNEVKSYYDESFIYRVGETVSVDNFDENRWNECSAGIHFFITREEAVRYTYW
jgi:hypothetical protein